MDATMMKIMYNSDSNIGVWWIFGESELSELDHYQIVQIHLSIREEGDGNQ